MLVFIQEDSALLSKLSDAFQAVTAEVEVKFPPINKNTKIQNIKIQKCRVPANETSSSSTWRWRVDPVSSLRGNSLWRKV